MKWLPAIGAMALLVSCTPKANIPRRPLPSLHVEPVTDLIAAAGLSWMAVVKPRAIESHVDLAPALELLIPHREVDAFAARSGLDPRALDAIAVAGFAEATLIVAKGPIDDAKVERAFANRAVAIEGRAIDRRGASPHDAIVRTWGSTAQDREQLALVGDNAIALEVGHFGPLRAAELFAEEKLKRSMPALRASPLQHADELAGDAPIRVFFAGPFEGGSARGFGGLLAATSAVAFRARIVDPEPVGVDHAAAIDGAFACTLTLTGDWKADKDAASQRLLSAFNVIAESALGKLAGFTHPKIAPHVHATDDALVLEITLDALQLARGLRAASGANIDEIMAY